VIPLPLKEKQKMSVEEVFSVYGNMLYRTAYVMLRNRQDSEDVVQDTLIKYMEHRKGFQDGSHRKAWLLRVCINLCRNKLLFQSRHPQIELKELELIYQKEEDLYLMEALMELPKSLKEVLLLHYVEGYLAKEIAEMLRLSEPAVKKRLERGRKKLKEAYGKEEKKP